MAARKKKAAAKKAPAQEAAKPKQIPCPNCLNVGRGEHILGADGVCPHCGTAAFGFRMPYNFFAGQ